MPIAEQRARTRGFFFARLVGANRNRKTRVECRHILAEQASRIHRMAVRLCRESQMR